MRGADWKRALRRSWRLALPMGIVLALGLAAAACGGDSSRELAPTATEVAATPTPETPTPTLQQVYAFLQAISPPTATPAPYTGGGGGGGGTSSGAPAPWARAGGTGPGPITSTDIHLSSAAGGFNVTANGRSIGTNGVMGDPSGAWMVVWYDFSANYPNLGGYPGDPGANAVFAGHVDYIRVGPAVFWGLKTMGAGDIINVTSRNGNITYRVEWARWVSPGEDFTGYVARNGTESITLVTCVGSFSAGHYSNRLVVRGVRI